MDPNKTIVLIDGSSFMYRAFYAANTNLSNAAGIPTGATHIYTRMLLGIHKEHCEDSVAIICVFDAKGKNFRHSMYPEYKANRSAMPDDLIKQVDFIHSITEAMGIPVVSTPGVEADDVLGTYARQAEAKGFDVLIYTGDKDLAQLVTPHIHLFDAMQQVFYDAEAVQKKFGVPPELVIDLLALKGDSADNIPGMAGTGEKKALAVLNGIGDIFTIKENLDKVVELGFRGCKSFPAQFKEQWDTIKLSYDLATIHTDLNLEHPLEDFCYQSNLIDTHKLIAIFDYLDFHSLSREIQKYKDNELTRTMLKMDEDDLQQELTKVEDDIQKTETTYQTKVQEQSEKKATEAEQLRLKEEEKAERKRERLEKAELAKQLEAQHPRQSLSDYKQGFHVVNTKEALVDLCHELSTCSYFSIFTENTDVRLSESNIVGIAFCTSEKAAYYIPLGHNYIACPEQLDTQEVYAALKPILALENVTKIGFDSKETRLALHFAAHLEMQGPMADLMVLTHILNSNQKLDLDDLMASKLYYDSARYHNRLEKGLAICAQDIDAVTEIACERALMMFRLYELERQELDDFPRGTIIFDHSMKTLDALYEMEKTGAYLDVSMLHSISDYLKQCQYSVQEQIFAITKEKFNLASVQQLGRVLFEDLAIPYPKKITKVDKDGRKAYSTSAEILTLLEDEYPIMKLIARDRFLSKIVSTYTDKFPKLISRTTGRIHTNFNLAGTATGRLSSSSPNLQNIPIRTEEGHRVRSAFTAPKGYKIVSADYSQIELRLIAHFSEDPSLCAAFNQHKDIHRSTAAELLDKPLEEVTAEERSHAKSTNFGLMYGMSSHGLAKQTGMSMKEAQNYIDNYFAKYPSLHNFMKQIVVEARKNGFITTLDGRHVTVPGLNSSGAARKQAERSAINAPMQGSAADIIRKAMVVVLQYMRTLEPDAARMTLQVHDELVFEVREDLVESFSQHIKDLMEHVVELRVPLEVGIGVGDNWGDAH